MVSLIPCLYGDSDDLFIGKRSQEALEENGSSLPLDAQQTRWYLRNQSRSWSTQEKRKHPTYHPSQKQTALRSLPPGGHEDR